MLLRVVDALYDSCKITVLLPDDVSRAQPSVQGELEAREVHTIVGPVPVVRRGYLTPTGMLTLLRRTMAFSRYLLKSKPDVLWCATSATLLCAPIARAIGVRRVVLHNQEIWKGIESTALGTLASSCTNIVAISSASKKSLPTRLAMRTTVILNATESPNDTIAPPDSGKPRFIIASRWNDWKGHRTLLHAWKRAGAPGWLLIAGGPPEAGVAVDVPRMIVDLDLTSSVEVVGEVADISRLIDQANFVVVPSDAPEPFGLVAIEAMAHARPVVGSSGGGLGEIIHDKQDGFLFENGSIEQLAQVLVLCTVDRSIEMSDAARQTFLREYSIPAFDRKLENWWTADILSHLKL